MALANQPEPDQIAQGYYPALRLLHAFACAGDHNYTAADSIALTEIGRITLSETRMLNMRDNPDLDAVLALHIGIKVYAVKQRLDTVQAVVAYERTIDAISSNDKMGLDRINDQRYRRAIVNLTVERILGNGLAVHVAEMNFQELLGKLNRSRNDWLVPIRNVDVYAMPQRLEAANSIYHFLPDFPLPIRSAMANA